MKIVKNKHEFNISKVHVKEIVRKNKTKIITKIRISGEPNSAKLEHL